MATASPPEPPGSLSGVARLVLDLAADRPATLGAGRLVCVDGPAGSGKTSLAAALAAAASVSPTVVHMDDLYDGWGGLERGSHQLATLLGPLADGRPGRYRRYDWAAGAYAETVTVDPTPLLVVEGVGSGPRTVADLVTVLVWVQAPADLRLARGLARDGEGSREEWLRWMVAEREVHARERTAERADVAVDGTGARGPTVHT